LSRLKNSNPRQIPACLWFLARNKRNGKFRNRSRETLFIEQKGSETTMVTLQFRQISVPPGHRVLFHEVSWSEFEAILEELGEHRAARVAYLNSTLEIRMPLPEHEKPKIIIGDLLKILLDELEINWEPFGSTTFKRQDMMAGIEPDDCFYIKNYAQMVGR
jgi:Uma2 family endonuclease